MAKQGFKVMDSDIHVDEPPDLWEKYIEPKFREKAPNVKKWVQEFGLIGWNFAGKPFPAFIDNADRAHAAEIRRGKMKIRDKELGRGPEYRKGEDPKAMLRAMDMEGVDVGVAFRTQAGHLVAIDGLDPELSAAVCRAYNNWLGDYCKTDPKRIKGAAMVPTQDVNLAVQEARRAVRDLGAVALILNSHPVNGRAWYDRYWDPLWAAASELNVPVTFHGVHTAYQAGQIGQRYMGSIPLARLGGQSIELILALGSLLAGGVIARFPKLRAGFFEGHCSWLPWWLWALDEHWEKFGDEEQFQLKMLPSEYFKRQCYVSADADEELVSHVLESVGNDNIVFSTDWPHSDGNHPKAVDTFLGLKGIDAESKRKILWDNCARLYGQA